MKTPNFLKFFEAMARVARRIMRGGRVMTSEKEQVDRLNECDKCPSFDPVARQCLECTCLIDAKSLLVTETCPKGRWKKL